MPRVLLLLALLSPSSAFASSVVFGPSTPVSEIRYVEAGGPMSDPIAEPNGDRVLVVWNQAEGAARTNEQGEPLDIPAIRLPKPEFTSGADVVADGDGWIVGWTIFGFQPEPSYLRLVRVSREGDVGDFEDIPLPRRVPQDSALHLVSRDGVMTGAYQMDRWEEGTRVAVFTAGRSEQTIVDGELRELTTTSDGFALLLQDRVVRLTAGVAHAGEVTLPPDFRATDFTTSASDLVIAGHTADGVAVARLRSDTSTAEIVARFATKSFDVSVAANGAEILLGWFGASSVSGVWDLHAARIRSDGSVEGPQLLREAIESSGKWVPPPTAPAVEHVDGAWVMIWSEGVRSPFFTWLNLYSTVVRDALQAVTEPALITWKAADQWFHGMAIFKDVTLVVWSEPQNFVQSYETRKYAARIGLDGRRIDAEPIALGEARILGVRASDTGFVIFREDDTIRLNREGLPIHESSISFAPAIECAPEACIAAWIEQQTEGGPASIRFARWRDAIVGPVITIHSSDRPINGFALSSDGDGFLLAFKRPGIPGGTIFSATRIELGPDGWTHRTSDFAASPRELERPTLIRQLDRYTAIWSSGNEWRGSHLTLEGHSMDGDETGWEGWPLLLDEHLTGVAFDGTRALLVASRRPDADVLYELRGRTPVVVGHVASDFTTLQCSTTGRCALAYQRVLVGDPWYRASRVFLQQFWFARTRAVRH